MMNAPVRERTIYKTVAVPVEIDTEDLVKLLTASVLMNECRRRGIKLKADDADRKYKIIKSDVDDVVDLYQRGDMEGALIALERLLPHPLRRLSVEVARFYRRMP